VRGWAGGHRRHVTIWSCEVMGGAPEYTEKLGGYEHMLGRHLGLEITPSAPTSDAKSWGSFCAHPRFRSGLTRRCCVAADERARAQWPGFWIGLQAAVKGSIRADGRNQPLAAMSCVVAEGRESAGRSCERESSSAAIATSGCRSLPHSGDSVAIGRPAARRRGQFRLRQGVDQRSAA
jgi:hypothetical protein